MSFMARTSQIRFPSASPARSGVAHRFEREQLFGSQTSCPSRWLEFAKTYRPCGSKISLFRLQYSKCVAGSETSI